MICSLVADCLYARDILDIKRKKNKPQNEWKHIDPFVKPFIKPKKGFGFVELRLLLYTRFVAMHMHAYTLYLA